MMRRKSLNIMHMLQLASEAHCAANMAKWSTAQLNMSQCNTAQHGDPKNSTAVQLPCDYAS